MSQSQSSAVDSLDSSKRLHDTATNSMSLLPKIAKLDSFERIHLPISDTVAAVTRGIYADDDQPQCDVESSTALSDSPLEFSADWLRTRYKSSQAHPLGLTYDESDNSDDNSVPVH